MTTESSNRRAHQQSRQKVMPIDRVYSMDTVVLEQGFRFAFPVDDDSPFNDLIVAIDIADETLRKR